MRITIDAQSGDGLDEAARELAKRRKRAAERISGGIVASLGWGAAYYFLGWHWAVFPFVFMGLMPLLTGAKGLVAARLEAPARRRVSKDQRRSGAERAILRVARDHAGRVTPALASIEAGLGLDEAQEALDSMASRGYATLDVLESGRVEYEFPEFTPGHHHSDIPIENV